MNSDFTFSYLVAFLFFWLGCSLTDCVSIVFQFAGTMSEFYSDFCTSDILSGVCVVCDVHLSIS